MNEEIGVIGSCTTPQQLPGQWYYEDNIEASPMSDIDDFALFNSIQSMHGVRNVTREVTVPTSEHVAEIVGRQGCKIKALRAKTNTYIKTPGRNERSVFVVTGRPEDVDEAKREIECAAEHFTHIRTSRKHSQGTVQAAGHVTTYVRVPLRVVGLVVGPKGATIKRIQQDTHTYIITPSREREPIFEVTGLPGNVEAARKEIEQHIYQRTGNMPITDPSVTLSQFSNGLPLNENHSPQSFNINSSSSLINFQNNKYSLTDGNMGLSSLLRSFPSMRESFRNDMTSEVSRSSTRSAITPLNSSSAFNIQRNANKVGPLDFDPWGHYSVFDYTDPELCPTNDSKTGRTSVWPTSIGINATTTTTSTSTAADRMIGTPETSLGANTTIGLGVLQSIWSDTPSVGSVSPSSSSDTPSHSENEKTMLGDI